MRDVVDSPSQKGSSVKDIKLIEKIISMIDAVIPRFEEFKEVEGETSDELEARKIAHNKMIEEIKAIEQELEFQPLEAIVIKSKFNSINNFLDNAGARKNIIALVEKLGI